LTKGQRLTLKRGAETCKVVVMTSPVKLQIGDEINRGSGAFWIVTKVEDTEIILTLKMHRHSAKPGTSPSSALKPTPKKSKSGRERGEGGRD
jgi:hypothetical protein